MKKILIVEDEAAISSYVAKELGFEDYETVVASDGERALQLFEASLPDAVLLDWMLPKLDGLTVLRRMKRAHPEIPIIFLTARDFVGDKVAGLDAGADDYLTKPYEIEELLARLRLIFRKCAHTQTTYQVGKLLLDSAAHMAKADGQVLDLTQREFGLLHYFMKNKGLALSRADILDEVWGMNFGGQENTVDAYVGYLRKKLASAGLSYLIESVRGVGYRLKVDENVN
ncbi:MAG: response regulator transcription factor [Streptococcaceae bacterium]|jgi:DNA-binding response OmpR family regulator|nr:response regulator transcription factor [Streptococcaceae bacterium]